MNKNLKKVISSLAALAISASAVSAFAVNFADVPEDASYAQAVQELSALDVISGYEDGTFKPDELVTRAQITKMIVDALNERAMAEASKANSQFTDVGDHWAKGYINQGVADKFIAGYGDGTFAPDANVTYVEAQKMLVSALGYETYAQGSGGWPNGYKTWASSQGITAGISGIADDTQLTRAQVAQLVDNAMGAPVCVITGYDTTIDGRRVPNLDIKDDEGKDYQTLFTKQHNAYKVYGRVTATPKSNSSMDNDKVTFRVEKADNFDDQWIGTAKNADEETVVEDMYFGETNAVDYLLTYAQALIQKDTNDEFTIISIAAAASAKTVTLAAEDFDADKTVKEASNKLYFYAPGTTRNSQKYALEDDYSVYVNGVANDALTDFDALVAYIDSHDTAAVTLEKQTRVGSSNTSTDYNLVNITSYEAAIVSDVVVKNDRITINFDDQDVSTSRMIVYLDDDTYTYNFTYNGEAIDPADLQEDDVLSIAYDASGNFADSSWYDVIVSRDVVEGVSISSMTDDEYTFSDGNTYKTLFGQTFDSNDMTSSFNLYLDHFGRIARTDEDSVNKKIAILKNVYKKAGGDYYAQIITKDGSEEEYKMDTDKATAAQTTYLGMTTADANGVSYGKDEKLEKYPQQVIEYSVASSTGKITIKKALSGVASAGEVTAPTKAEFRASSNKLGSIKLNDATIILDLSEVEDDKFDVIAASTLVDGNSYTAVGYDETTSGTKYNRFVILTDGVANYNSETQLAVIMKVESVSDDGTTKTQFKLAVDGDEQSLIVDDKIADAADYKEGDIIIYKTNGSNYITGIELVSKEKGMLSGTTWTAFQAKFMTGSAAAADFIANAPRGTWSEFLADANSDEIDFVAGVVANKNGQTVTIQMPISEDGKVAVDYDDRASEFNLSGAKTYSYNFAASNSKGASKVSLDDGILTTSGSKTTEFTGTGNHTYLDLTNELTDDIVFAIARVDDDEVKEIVFIYNED